MDVVVAVCRQRCSFALLFGVSKVAATHNDIDFYYLHVPFFNALEGGQSYTCLPLLPPEMINVTMYPRHLYNHEMVINSFTCSVLIKIIARLINLLTGNF